MLAVILLLLYLLTLFLFSPTTVAGFPYAGESEDEEEEDEGEDEGEDEEEDEEEDEDEDEGDDEQMGEFLN